MKKPYRVTLDPKLSGSEAKSQVKSPTPSVSTGDEAQLTRPLSRFEILKEKLKEEDRVLDELNADVVHYQDPVASTEIKKLVALFAKTEGEHVSKLAEVLLEEAASLNSLVAVKKVIKATVGESLEIDRNKSTSGLIAKIHEVRFIELYCDHIKLDGKIKEHLVQQYLAREWGPKLAEPIEVKVTTADGANSGGRRKPPERRKPPPPNAPRGATSSRGAEGSAKPPLTTPIAPARNPWTGR